MALLSFQWGAWAFSNCIVWASHCKGFSCGGQALVCPGFGSCGSQAVEHMFSSCGTWA